ncbi:non-ribosomal peptide synthetase [Actinokineospora globicatena]|uniref:non-ribosomal peptide synthetase n=1 Tax=Actinokineospora globicatena TaxID=103729 RepID=UPI0020A40788|nr:amino acid adenylation domain-containing protein [Actinokineospora globicatena]MCP2302930.1 amino acid adenylation domain-containing protein/thioester reductase domain-containing protein [Actinokineospora globicatena]GLW78683.1 non-ribosomal peptide synthetase [Actinokineospora globicatena]GLW84649.1 non-ribosomal peptide synthetase [Actinokineospora globicatena]
MTSIAPQSFAQRRMWFLDALYPGSPLYNVAFTVRVRGPLDLTALRGALDVLVARHDALRTVFAESDGEPVQIVRGAGSADVTVVPVTGSADAERLIDAEARRPFDLSTGPLLRVLVLRLADDDHHVMITLHHIVTDGWSQAVLFTELSAAYAALVRGHQPELPPLPLTYSEYTRWQLEEAKSPLGELSLEYWVDALRGAPELLALPTDRPRPATQSFEGAVYRKVMPSAAIAAALPELGGTMFMVLLAAYQALLARYSGQDDIVVGTAVNGRSRPDAEPLVGLFVNTIPLRTSLAGDPTFRELVARVRDVALDGMSYADVPLERIVAAVTPSRGQGHAPVFQVGFTVTNLPPTVLELAGAEVSVPDFVTSGTAKVDLMVAAAEIGDEMVVDIEYDVALFDRSTIEVFADRFARFTAAVVAAPDTRVRDIDLTTDEERIVPGGADFSPAPLVPGLIAARSESTPDAVAVVDGDQVLTYGELSLRANALAWRLREHGVGPETIVALGFSASVEAIVAIVGIHAAGGAYLPVDPSHPTDRLAALLVDAAPSVLVTNSPEAFPGYAGPVLAVDVDEVETAPPNDLDRDHLAYVIYTSGSTGAPKGVAVQHGTLANLAAAFADAHPFGPADRVLMIPPLTFDASAGDVFPALISGSALVLCHDPAALSGADVIRLCAEQDITMVDTAAPLWRKWTDDLIATGVPGPSPLRTMMVGGDAVDVAAVRDWTALTGVTLVNHYGPTEATVCATLHVAAGDEPGTRLPIGKPLPHVRAYVLDDDLRPVLAGLPGELCLGGDTLARGYLGRGDLTADRFVPDPFGPPGSRLYRTGDLARWRPGGVLEFLGRVDRQVKIRGHRVEPAEIEAACRVHPDVADALVVARADDRGEVGLVAYVVSDHPADLRAFLRASLPEYLVPSEFVGLAQFPVTGSGKLDMAALPEPVRQPKALVRPRSATARVLAAEWSALLGVDAVGEDDDFFALGGHSLLAARMITRVRLALDIDIPLRAVFDASSLGELAAIIDRQSPAAQVDLWAEAVLPDDIRPTPGPSAIDRASAPDTILLTGATGFLGGYLLADALAHTTARVYCLVRADSEADALARIERGLRTYGLWTPSAAERIVPVPGDLGSPRLGLTEDRFDELSRTVDTIIHCGGTVHFAQSYAELKSANVSGTIEVLRLATRHGGIPVHFISTLGVYPLHLPGTITEGDIPDEPDQLERGYEQTKWVADTLVRAAGDAGLPVTVHRPARVTGDSHTGASSGADLFASELRAVTGLGATPDLDVAEDMAPVDHVASAIGWLSRQPSAYGHNFHFYNSRTITSATIAQTLRDHGYPVSQIPYSDWYATLQTAAATSPDPALSAIAAASNPTPDLRLREFDCTTTETRLAAADIICPPADQALLHRYLNHFIHAGHLPAPEVTHVPS